MSIARSLLRSARPLSSLPRSCSVPISRTYATVTVASSGSNSNAPLLANIEASWEDLPAEEQGQVYQQLKELQKRDWKEMSLDEKKAAYYVAFGPHGPRKPYHEPGHGIKVFFGTCGIVGAGVAAFLIIRAFAPEPPHTMSREYQEKMTEYMRSQNNNPITGVSSEGYKGKGMVQ